MDRIFVQSSNVTAVGFDEATETLEVEFSGGSIYQYYNVPQHLYELFMQAASKGQFLNVYIKNSHAFSRVG